MSITETVKKIEALCLSYTPKYRPRELVIGPPGNDIDKVLCVDGSTHQAVSLMLREYYSYSRSWQLNAVDLTSFDPEKMSATLGEANIAAMIRQDFDEELIEVDEMRKDNAFLISVDYPPSPFERAYGVFTDDPEPFFVLAGSEVKIFHDLEKLLAFQLEVIEITVRQQLT